MSDTVALYEYENILIGKASAFRVAFRDTDIEKRRKTAGEIWRYAISDVLGWTPDMALLYLNQDLIKQIKLDLTYPKIDYSYSKKKFFDLRFILQYAYPGIIKYNLEEDAKAEFERVNRLGAFENYEKGQKFQKHFFSGLDGVKRAAVILNYAISLYLDDLTTQELYKFFQNTPKATSWLRKHKIDLVVKKLYPTPLDYLHNSLPSCEENNIYYINEYLNTALLAMCEE